MSDYRIEFTEGGPGLLENAITFGTASLANDAANKLLDTKNGWYCRATDRATGLHETRWGYTKVDAEKEARNALDSSLENFSEEKERQAQRRKEEEQTRKKTRPQYQESSTNPDNAFQQLLIKLVAGILVIAAIVWFVLSVAIPLLVINIAIIAFVFAFLNEKKVNKFIYPLSVLGAVYVVADYNMGLMTKALVSNVSFFRDLIPVFLYANLTAGLLSAYFWIRNLLNEFSPPVEEVGEFSKRNLTIISCLVIVGVLTIGLQVYFEAQNKNVSNANQSANPEVRNTQTSITNQAQTNSQAKDSLTSSPVSKSSYVGVWHKPKKDGIQVLPANTLSIELLNNDNFRLIVKDADFGGENGFENVSYYNGVINGSFYFWGDSKHTSTFQITMVDNNTILYKADGNQEYFTRFRDTSKISPKAVPTNTTVNHLVSIHGEFKSITGDCTPYALISITGNKLLLQGINYSGSRQITYSENYVQATDNARKFYFETYQQAFILIKNESEFSFNSPNRNCNFIKTN